MPVLVCFSLGREVGEVGQTNGKAKAGMRRESRQARVSVKK